MAIITNPFPGEDADSDGDQQTAHHHAHQHHISNASTASVDIEAWTVSALESLSIAPIVARGTGNTLSIPLDDHGHHPVQQMTEAPARLKLKVSRRPRVRYDDDEDQGYETDKSMLRRRDSLRRREALLKGKEGSRQRRRWENDRLLHVPNVQPPLPTDWQPHPTHPVHVVPYQLAQYWDKGLRERVEERKSAFAMHRKKKNNTTLVVTGVGDETTRTRAEAGKVPKQLRAKARKTPAVKSWLRVLEEPVRQYIITAATTAAPPTKAFGGHGASDSDETMDSEDEEIVFVGRNGSMRDGGRKIKATTTPAHTKGQQQQQQQQQQQGMVLDWLGDDETGAFKRWLTHSISDYYGLDSRSVTVGEPARRVVYVGIKQAQPQKQQKQQQQQQPVIRSSAVVLPPPLWEMF